MSRWYLRKLGWLCCLIAILALTGCAGKSSRQDAKTGVVFEPGAIEKEPALTEQEVACLKSTGEIDKNLTSTAMSDVTKQYRYYLREGRKHMQISAKRSEPYLPYVRAIFGQKGLPKDLAYLAIVESGYRPTAKSHAGAAGAWQFVPGTGKHYGLHQDGWTDERMDIYESTEAAAEYLGKLYKRFKDWPTAIAAYNAGEGKMSRAMAASGSKNFFEVRERNETLSYELQLREETKQYVPRFIAVTKIMRNLRALNFETNGSNDVVIERLTAKPGTDLKRLSKAIDMGWGDFCKLNTHHKAEITSVAEKTYVYVPKEKAKQGQEYLEKNHKGDYEGWKVCTIAAPGQSWQKLGSYYHVSGDKLRKLNPGCSLKTGELVYLPAKTQVVAAHSPRLEPSPKLRSGASISLRQEAKASHDKNRTHTLKSSETLYAVARRYGVSPVELARVNHITDPSHLPTGKVLQIPSYQVKPENSRHYAAASPAEGGSMGTLGQKKKAQFYVVQEKDNLWNIARRNHVSVDDLKRWNNVDEHNLRLGSKLRVYAD